jgi:hypothetical protein
MEVLALWPPALAAPGVSAVQPGVGAAAGTAASLVSASSGSAGGSAGASGAARINFVDPIPAGHRGTGDSLGMEHRQYLEGLGDSVDRHQACAILSRSSTVSSARDMNGEWSVSSSKTSLQGMAASISR